MSFNELDIKNIILDYMSDNNLITERSINMVNRYISFIEYKKLNTPAVYEVHHILPQSIFPEYKLFSNSPWNAVKLSLRCHYIAHIMLHYIFGEKMTYALYRMLSKDKRDSRLYEHIRLTYLNSEECKINARKGAMSTVSKLKDGMRIYYKNNESVGLMYPDDPRIKKFGLVNFQRTERQAKQRAKRSQLAKISNTGTTVYNNGKIQKKFRPDAIIPDGFVKGGLPRNLVKGHTKKYDFTTKDNQDYIIKLLKEHNGSLEKIGKIIGMAGVNVKYNINKYMPNIDHTEYFTRLYKYQNDKAYKDEIDNLYEDPIDRIKYIDIDEYNNIIDIRNKIINSDINLKSNGWITKVTLLLGKNRKFVVRFMQTYMYDVDAYWR